MVNAGPYGQCKAVCKMQGQCRAVWSMQEPIVVNAGPYWSLQGRMVNAGPYGQCRAVWSMQGRMVNAGPYGQCRAVWSVQGRMVNARPYAFTCRAVKVLVQGFGFRVWRMVSCKAVGVRGAGPYGQCRAKVW